MAGAAEMGAQGMGEFGHGLGRVDDCDDVVDPAGTGVNPQDQFHKRFPGPPGQRSAATTLWTWRVM